MAVFTGNGSVGSPSFTFSSDTSTGLYHPSSGIIAITANSINRVVCNSNGVGINRSPSYSLDVDGGAYLRDGLFSEWGDYTIFKQSFGSPASFQMRAYTDTGSRELIMESWGDSTTSRVTLRAGGPGGASDIVSARGDKYLRMASGTNGIQFNGDTAAANALDDYEEGTWTPSLFGGLTGGTVSYANYVKIGKLCSIQLRVTSLTYNATGAYATISLPFAPIASRPAVGRVNTATSGYVETVFLAPYTANGGGTVGLQFCSGKSQAQANDPANTLAGVSTNKPEDLVVAITYEVN